LTLGVLFEDEEETAVLSERSEMEELSSSDKTDFFALDNFCCFCCFAGAGALLSCFLLLLHALLAIT